MYGDADCARLICDGASDRLPDPPCCVGREFEAFGIIELIDGFQQTHVALLDEVEELHPSADIFFRDTDDETEIRFRETVFRRLIVRVFRETPCEILFFLGCQQRYSADILQIDLHRVIRCAACAGECFFFVEACLDVVIEQLVVGKLQIEHMTLLIKQADLLVGEFLLGKVRIELVLGELSARLDLFEELFDFLLFRCCHMYHPPFFGPLCPAAG